MSELLHTVALAVRAGREKLVLSQRELAEKADVGSATIGRIETAQPGVSLAALAKVLDAVGLRLAVVDAHAEVWRTAYDALESDLDDARDRLGRRLPAHLFHTSHSHRMWWISRQLRYPGTRLDQLDRLGYRLRNPPEEPS